LIYVLLEWGLLNMDITATLNEIASLSIEDRIHIVQEIWDGIAADSLTESLGHRDRPKLTKEQKHELDARIDDYDQNPDNVMTWEEIKTSIKGQ
jgi:putative addiction module component (TIGR02574 family)